MLTTGEFSSASRLTIKALRIYHTEGLLVPEKVDPNTGYRYYGDESFRKAGVILLLRDLGFSIGEMKEILSKYDDDDELADFFSHRLEEVAREMHHLRDVRDRIGFFIESTKEDIMNKNLEICEKNLSEIRICGIRYSGTYGEIGKYFGDLFKKAGRYMRGKPFAIYYDREYKESCAEIEAAVEVRKEFSTAGVSCRVLPGGRFVCIVHRGAYDYLGTAYKALFEYLQERNLAVTGPTREIYHKGPGMILPRDPKRFVTEIMIPVSGNECTKRVD